MKKPVVRMLFFAVILIVFAVLVSGCGANKGAVSLEGTKWLMTAETAGDMQGDQQAIEDEKVTYEFKAGGVLSYSDSTSTAQGTYKEDGNEFTATLESLGEFKGSFEGDKMTIVMDGIMLEFEKQ